MVYWTGWFLCYVVGIVACGGIIGGVIYVTLGVLSHPDLHWAERLLFGLRDGGQYAGVWAGGLSIVMCVMKGYKQACARSTNTVEVPGVG